MATTSGQVTTNIAYDSYFWVKWSLYAQDYTTNYSGISWECGVHCGHSFYQNAIKMSAFTVGGVPVYPGGTYSNFSPGDHTLASDIAWLEHDASGKKTFSISPFTGWLYSNYNYSSDGDSWILPDIPRQASITSAPNFTDTENPTIGYSNPAGNAVTALAACISLTTAIDDVKYRAISKTGSSYTFTLTDSERAILRNNTINSRDVYFYVRTTIGDAVYYSTLKRTFTVTQNDATKPTVQATAQLNNSGLPDKFSGMYIKGKSKLNVTVTASGKFGASIKSISASMDEVSYTGGTFTTQAFKTSGTVSLTASAKDSRGFTAQAVVNATVMDYDTPSVLPLAGNTSVQCYRSDGNGIKSGSSTSVWIKARRSYSKLETGGVQKNQCALQWRYKSASGTYGDWQELIGKGSSTDDYDALVTGVFDQKQAYTIQIRAIDDFAEAREVSLDIPTEDVALHLGKGGKNVSVGTYCDYTEDYTFRSAWKAIFENGVYIGSNRIADFIVEQGVSGSWTYRKWNSGLAECWMSNAYRPTTANAFNVYTVYLPFSFANTAYNVMLQPTVNGQLLSSFSVADKAGNNSKTVSSFTVLVHYVYESIYNTHFDIRVTGRWK